MHILFLSNWYPYPASNGSKLRIFNLLRGLSQHHTITLVSFVDADDQPDPHSPLHRFCAAVHTVPKKLFAPDSLRAKAGFFSRNPRSVLDKFSPDMAQLIADVVVTTDIDLVIASQVDMAGYRRYFADLPAIFEEVEVGVLYEQMATAVTWQQHLRHQLTWQKHRGYLQRLLRTYDGVTVVSAQEAALLQKTGIASKPVTVVPNGVDAASYQTETAVPQPNTLIFTGSFSFRPNYDAMVWFVGEVLPLVRAAVPDVRLIITGKHGNRPLPSLDNVELAGFVDDVRPYIQNSWVSIAPILSGGGTRLKILEAMAAGTPVVATSKGAEGINVTDGIEMFIADTPQAQADAIIRLLRDADLRQQMAAKARQIVQNQYDWSVIVPTLLAEVNRIMKLEPKQVARETAVLTL